MAFVMLEHTCSCLTNKVIEANQPTLVSTQLTSNIPFVILFSIQWHAQIIGLQNM